MNVVRTLTKYSKCSVVREKFYFTKVHCLFVVFHVEASYCASMFGTFTINSDLT